MNYSSSLSIPSAELPSMNALYLIVSTSLCIIVSYLQLKNRNRMDVLGANFIFCTLWISGWVLKLDDWTTKIWIYYVVNNCLAAISNYISHQRELNRSRAFLLVLMCVNLTLFCWNLQTEGYLYYLAYRLPITILKVNAVMALGQIMIVEWQLTFGTLCFILLQLGFFMMLIDCKIAGSYWPCLNYLVGFASILVCAGSVNSPKKEA